jgi:hypothetical protein
VLHLKQPSTIPEYSDLEIEYWVQVVNKKVLIMWAVVDLLLVVVEELEKKLEVMGV